MPLDPPPEDHDMEDRLRAVEDAVLKINTLFSGLATKENLAELRGVMQTDLAELRGELKAEILAAKVALLDAMNAQTWKFVTWVTGIFVVVGGALASAAFLIARYVH